MDITRIIRAILEPSIKVKEIKRLQLDTKIDQKDEAILEPDGAVSRTSTDEGGLFPVVVLKDYLISHKFLQKVSLNTNGDIPEINFSFEDIERIFELEIPMDGDEICLYLRPSDTKNLKPIRIDFDVTGVVPTMGIDDDTPTIYNVRGIMKIPGFFNDTCKSFKSNTTFEHLQDVCELVGLGFASNIEFTEDKMTRICPYTSLRQFVSDTVDSCYLSEKSFFKWYIDPYYYLCLVDVNKQIRIKMEPDKININKGFPSDSLYLEKDTDPSNPGELILSNSKFYKRSNVYIRKWSVSLEHGLWLSDGYITNPVIYDIDTQGGENEKIVYTIDPLITEGSERTFRLQKGKKGDSFYKTQIKYNWEGKQEGLTFGGNVHDSFLFAKQHNIKNNKELNKLKLEVELNGTNFNIQKYMILPVEIYQTREDGGNWKEEKIKKRDEDVAGDENYTEKPKSNVLRETGDESSSAEKDRQQYLNKFLSGYYLVTGIRYTYTRDSIIKMHLTLTRREHNLPAENNNLVKK